MSKVEIMPEYLPRSKRLHLGTHYATLSQPGIRVPFKWEMSDHPLLLQFFGYWLGKGGLEKFGVRLSGGSDIAELINIFDYIADTFKCNYRIKDNKVVRFDSALLKYTMLGFGFGNSSFHQWMNKWCLSPEEIIEILRGFFTAKAKINKKRAELSIKTDKSIVNLIGSLLSHLGIGYMVLAQGDKFGIKIESVQSLEKIYVDIGFLSAKKNLDLYNLLFE